jgi:outer membrane protein assembly factor BamB
MLASAVALLAPAARAEDWPHWRGPSRDGNTTESSNWSGEHWLAAKPTWTKNVGIGSTSPLVVAGRLYVLGWHKDRDALQCFDASSGEAIWSQTYPCPRYGRKATGDEGLYAGPSASPEYDRETKRLYTLSIDGDLQCWETARDGERVWSRNLYREFDPPRRPKFGRSGLRDYGYTSSPLVYGPWLLVEVGDDEGNLMAFDKATGEPLWKSQCRDAAGHTGGPVPMTVEDIPCVVVLTCKHLVVVRLDAGHEGQTLAELPWETDFANNIATPTVIGNEVLVTSAYNRNAMCKLRVAPTGLTKVWEQPYPSKVCSPVVSDGAVYVAWDRLRCLDFQTGQLRWEGARFGDDGSCVVTSDGRLVVWGRGSLVLCETARRSASAYRELARIDRLLHTDCWPHVVLAAGRMYCKDRGGQLSCFVARP